MEHLEFDLADEFIELKKLLKVTGVCQSGGEAKALIWSEHVTVDGLVDMRAGRKIRTGETVQTGDVRIVVRAAMARPNSTQRSSLKRINKAPAPL